MYKIPKSIDLSAGMGWYITQFCIGSNDIQFNIGDVQFSVQSEINLFYGGVQVGGWRPNLWPSDSFGHILNIVVVGIEVASDIEIMISFGNGYSMHLYDEYDQYESMQIKLKGSENLWII